MSEGFSCPAFDAAPVALPAKFGLGDAALRDAAKAPVPDVPTSETLHPDAQTAAQDATAAVTPRS
ncbi:MAG: hypothetical protein JNM76_05990 [Betaproteobacteria bacterium]|nr:hypothetical protein [Betaproteobacteria bacterium]